MRIIIALVKSLARKTDAHASGVVEYSDDLRGEVEVAYDAQGYWAALFCQRRNVNSGEVPELHVPPEQPPGRAACLEGLAVLVSRIN